MRSAKKSLVQLRSLKKGGFRLVLRVKISADTARKVEAILATSTMRADTYNRSNHGQNDCTDPPIGTV
jgi:hypothetical protein